MERFIRTNKFCEWTNSINIYWQFAYKPTIRRILYFANRLDPLSVPTWTKTIWGVLHSPCQQTNVSMNGDSPIWVTAFPNRFGGRMLLLFLQFPRTLRELRPVNAEGNWDADFINKDFLRLWIWWLRVWHKSTSLSLGHDCTLGYTRVFKLPTKMAKIPTQMAAENGSDHNSSSLLLYLYLSKAEECDIRHLYIVGMSTYNLRVSWSTS